MTTLTIPDHLTKSLPQCDEATLLEIFKKGLAQYQAEKGLEAYLPYLQTDNLIAASHQAKKRAEPQLKRRVGRAIAKSTILTTRIVYKKGLERSNATNQSFLISNPCSDSG